MKKEKSGIRLYNLSFVILLLLTACGKPGRQQTNDIADDDTLAVVASDYKDDLYNQGHTNACWIYAMCACIEHEQLRQGDSVTLSRQWLMSHYLEEQAIDYYLTRGARDISMRGVGPDVLRLIHDYGLVPYVMERSCINNSNVLERKLKLMCDLTPNLQQSSNSPLSPRYRGAETHGRGANSINALRNKIADILPRFTVANIPPHGGLGGSSFYYYSMRYTPWQFAESIMYDQQWEFFASESFHPWHQPFVLEVADNRRYHQFMNIPMQEMYSMVVQSLKVGHPVYWEYGKVPREKSGGVATSDHAMAIVAYIPQKELGGSFLCLNSYGKDWGRNGYCLVSKAFFLHHTCDIGVVQSAMRR